MEPGKTSFFQALNVPTKIARGTIEITTDLKLVETGNKVGASEATLLNMLNISPFTYGMGIAQVYDEGQTFPASVLDVGEEQLLSTLSSVINTVACISLAINYPTLPSVIHSVFNSYKNILAVAVETDYSWPEIEELKDRIANPDAYASAAPTAAAGGGAAAEAAPAEEKEEEAEESDDEGFGGLLYVIPFVLHAMRFVLLTNYAVTRWCRMKETLDLGAVRQHDNRIVDLDTQVHRLSADELESVLPAKTTILARATVTYVPLVDSIKR
jgi:large subunit ribosomal protein LP0